VSSRLAVISESGESRLTDEVPAKPKSPGRRTPTPPATPESLRCPRATAIDAKDPQLRALLGPGHTIVRAWSIPTFKGHVLLSRYADQWCLSAPDTATGQPDIERGMSCATGAQSSVAMSIGSDYVAVVLDEGAKPPTLRLPNGHRRTLMPREGGLIALAGVPAGSSITLYDRAGRARTNMAGD
jgi:hypothetical protein